MKSSEDKAGRNALIMDILFMLGVAAAVFLLTVTNAFSDLDHILTDALYQVPRGVSGKIKIIGVDEETLEVYGPINTWSRGIYAKLIDDLTGNPESCPDIIGFDIQFSGHVDEEGDREFALAAERYGNAVTVMQFLYEPVLVKDENGNMSYRIKELYLPYEELKGVCDTGFSNISQDSDGTVRRITTVTEYEGNEYYSFPYMIYSRYCSLNGTAPEAYPIDKYGRSIIDYSGKPGDYEYISMARVLNGDIDPRAFDDCIVLVGAYAPGMQDAFNVPTGGSRQMYGVEVHANILQGFIQNRFSINGDPKFYALITAVFAALLTLLFRKKRMVVSAVCLIIAIVCELAAGVMLHNKGTVISLLYFPLVIVISYVMCVVEGYITEYNNRARILKAFSKYVAPQIIEEIARKGNYKVSLESKSRDISVLFVDIRGFTTMSEALSAEDVVKILNRYLELTTKAVFDNMGTLDKFVGDCTMAVFNSPFDLEDYEFKSVCAAMDIAMGSEPLNKMIEEEFGRKIGFGVGVNCGHAVAGNIGCDFRMDYTAIGDTVNTAARLEANAGAGKVYISDVLYARIKERVDVEEVGVIPLKGKKNGVVVYSVTAVHKDIPAPSPEEKERRRKLYNVAGNMPESTDAE